MAKWADLLISAVRYSADETHIEKVRVHEDLGEQVGSPKISSRTDVVSNIKNRLTYMTIVKNAKGNWRKGQEVHTIRVGNEEFIRTDKNSVAKDNLENLPEF